jgi:signal peptidase II
MGQTTTANRARQALAVPLLVAAVVVLLDQLAKWIVNSELGPASDDHRAEVIGQLFAFQYVENSGAAFGLLRGQTVVLTLVATAVVIALVASYQRARNYSWQLVVGLGLLLGGAVGNLLDRIRLGYVIDFVSISLWPKFNIADSAITIGVILIAWHAFAHDHLISQGSYPSEIATIAPERDAPK